MSDVKNFRETIERNERVDSMLIQLKTSQWRMTLFCLYWYKKVEIPQESKTCSGADFGYCDKDGALAPREEATHIGWTLTHEEVNEDKTKKS